MVQSSKRKGLENKVRGWMHNLQIDYPHDFRTVTFAIVDEERGGKGTVLGGFKGK